MKTTINYISDPKEKVYGEEEAPEGIYTYNPSGRLAYSRLKLEQTPIGGGKLKIRATIEAKTSFWWSNKINLSFGNFGLQVNDGERLSWTAQDYPTDRGTPTEDYEAVAVAETEIVPGKAKSFKVTMKGSDATSVKWAFYSNTFGAVRPGDYIIPIPSTGSEVLIGGQRYKVFIGSGTALEPYNVFIGGERY